MKTIRILNFFSIVISISVASTNGLLTGCTKSPEPPAASPTTVNTSKPTVHVTSSNGNSVSQPARLSLDEQHLQQRIGKLTKDELVSRISSTSAAGRTYNHNQFLWAATGFIRANPASADALRLLYSNGNSNTGRRALIADLLTHAGTPEAQAALISSLQHSVTAGDQNRIYLWQRLSLVSNPTVPTVKAATDRLTQVVGNDKLAIMHALGSIGKNSRISGNGSVAKEIQTQLEQLYAQNTEDETRQAALAGIGNLNEPKTYPILTRALTGSSIGEQLVASHALARQSETPAARKIINDTLRNSRLSTNATATLVRALAVGTASLDDLVTLQRLTQRTDLDPKVLREVSLALTKKMPASYSDSTWRSAVSSLAAQSPSDSVRQAQGLSLLMRSLVAK